MNDSDFSDNQEEGDEGHDEVLDPDNPEHAFAIIEKNYMKTIIELENRKDAAQFADDFNKLFDAYYNTYIIHKETETQYDCLEKDLDEKRAKLEVAIKVTEADKTTIHTLKVEIEKAWELADAAHAREQLAQEIIDNLRAQVENLNAEIEFKNKMNQDTDDVGDLSKHKDGLERERDKLMNEVTQLTTKLVNAIGYQEELEKKTSMADIKINELTNQLEDHAADMLRERRAKEELVNDLAEERKKIEDRDLEIRNTRENVVEQGKRIAKLEIDVRDHRYIIDRLNKENEVATNKVAKLQDDYNTTAFDLEKTKSMFQKKQTDLKSAEEENTRLKTDLAKLIKAKELADKRIVMLNGDKDEINIDRHYMRQRIAVLEKEVDDYKRFMEEDRRALEAASKDKEGLNKTIQRHQAAARDQEKLIQIQNQSKKKLEIELDTFFIESGKQKKQIHQLERERDKLAEEQLELTKTIEDNMDDIRAKKAQIFDLKRTIQEKEMQVRQQQNIYEAIRADRNSLQKSLQESTAECGELKKKLKIVFHQTEQLKEDVAMKEKLLVKDENTLRKAAKEKDNLRIEVMAGLNQIRELRKDVKEQKDEEKRLHKTILAHEKVIRSQIKDTEQLMNERDVLGSQLVRRNDEIALLHEKIKILRSTLSRGETQYDQRLQDIKLLKIVIKRMRQEKMLIAKSMNNMVDLRQEIFHLERDLTQARLQCKALEQEAQNPLNIHRWRKLEGSDPEVVDLLQKIRSLQKRLLQQASQAVEKERKLKEAERLYLNLRKVLAKQPGPGIRDELVKTQRSLKNRGNKLKCLVAELNMSELKAAEYKTDVEKLAEELREIKEKYFQEKKTNHVLRMAQRNSDRPNSPSSMVVKDAQAHSQTSFTGGGFRMSVPQSQQIPIK
ncbi:unnamed protein product [Ceutorhynchus assimilis]|uniref:Cilia- and flagella-associated protein 58 central coiled coil domain-containing protein n=1 Tax=Ceutorhynchus assimilis TaxID=467358 RepID=A0A9N9QRZ2_9CUCU|nr:unnamed protein product [Ceutorhynchus assimilis]